MSTSSSTMSAFSIFKIEDDNNLEASSTYSFLIDSSKFNLAIASDKRIRDSNYLTVIL